MSIKNDKNDVYVRLEQAEKLRKDADQRAKEIEAGILKDLKLERSDLLAKLESVNKSIERISGKATAPKVSNDSGLTVKEAILQVLADGKAANVKHIVTKVNEIRPGTVVTAVSQGIMQLKKLKQIKQESRGIYKKV